MYHTPAGVEGLRTMLGRSGPAPLPGTEYGPDPLMGTEDRGEYLARWQRVERHLTKRLGGIIRKYRALPVPITLKIHPGAVAAIMLHLNPEKRETYQRS